MNVIRHGDNCMVKQLNSNKSVDAVVFDFTEQKHLTVVLNKSIKLPMTWNGKMYEGRMAGIDFVSDGPTVNKSKTSRG